MLQTTALKTPRTVVAGLRLVNTAESTHQLPDETERLERLAAGARAELVLDAPLLHRLARLWAGLIGISADEVSEWALDAAITLKGPADLPLPEVLAVGASVYASGEVALSLTLEGFDARLWLDGQLELTELIEPFGS